MNCRAASSAMCWRPAGCISCLLLALTVSVFLLEIVPLELQRRIVNDLVKDRPYRWVIMLCAVYAGVVLVQGGTKLVLNVYRGWVGERAVRDLRRRIHAVIEAPPTSLTRSRGARDRDLDDRCGSRPDRRIRRARAFPSLCCRAASCSRCSPTSFISTRGWRSAAFALFVPQFLFVPLLQAAVNRRAGARIRILRQLGIGVIDQANGQFRADDQRIDRVFALDMGIFRLKFTMNFLMNLCSHLQIISALLIGGWWVYTDRLEIGGVVAFISGISRLNDPWGDLVNYFRDLTVTQVKYRLLANAVNELARDRLDLSGTVVKLSPREVIKSALPE